MNFSFLTSSLLFCLLNCLTFFVPILTSSFRYFSSLSYMKLIDEHTILPTSHPDDELDIRLHPALRHDPLTSHNFPITTNTTNTNKTHNSDLMTRYPINITNYFFVTNMNALCTNLKFCCIRSHQREKRAAVLIYQPLSTGRSKYVFLFRWLRLVS